MVRNSVGVLLLLLWTLDVTSQSYTIETVPNTKLINNSYVSNPDGLLSDGTVSQINLLLDSLEKKTTAQVAVVMLNSIAPLTEASEDEFLSAETLFEENLKSVDYYVWKCNPCGDFHYEMDIPPKTKFTKCPKCSTYALYQASSSTISAASTSSSGVREVILQCKYCHKKIVVEETIPMITACSDSSSSSSSSDSGGSCGGGDSGGGGSSSSW